MIDKLRQLLTERRIVWTVHVVNRIEQRGIDPDEVEQAIMTGEIIEVYPDDYPYPSCLILGGNNLHVVCGMGNGRMWVITAYRPSLDKWEPDLKTRKGR